MLSIFLPTYNEADNITELIERTMSSLKEYEFEIVVVDDNSPDGTAEVAKKLNERYGRIRVLKRPRKLGLASAFIDGMKVANGQILAVMDADLQHPLELLPEMYEKVKEGHDLAIASRYVKEGCIEGWSLWRRIISKGAIAFAHLLLPRTRKIKDPISGYFMFDRKIVDGVELRSMGYKVLLEVLVNGKYDLVAEVPYVFKPRKKGRSKMDFKEIINYALLLLKLR